MAHVANEKVLLDVYNNGEDAHTKVAALMFKKDVKDVTKQERTIAKSLNFGIMYGMGANKLSDELKIEKSEAQELINKYLGSMTSVKKYLNNTEKFLVKNGYTETFYGRRRYIPKVYSDNKLDKWAAIREGINATIQGGNADIIKLAMIAIDKELIKNNFKSIIILQVHDELVLDVHPHEEKEVLELVIRNMQNVVKFKVPMIAEAHFGNNWSEAH